MSDSETDDGVAKHKVFAALTGNRTSTLSINLSDIPQAYVEFIRLMGPQWLEKNMALFIDHIVSLAGNPKATPTHIDAVYARKCIVFIMATVIQVSGRRYLGSNESTATPWTVSLSSDITVSLGSLVSQWKW